MRTVEEIKVEMVNLAALEAQKPYAQHDSEALKEKLHRLQGELLVTITHDISIDRLEEICNADRDNKLYMM